MPVCVVIMNWWSFFCKTVRSYWLQTGLIQTIQVLWLRAPWVSDAERARDTRGYRSYRIWFLVLIRLSCSRWVLSRTLQDWLQCSLETLLARISFFENFTNRSFPPLRTFARKFSNTDFFLRLLPLYDDELCQKWKGDDRLRFGENMPGRTP